MAREAKPKRDPKPADSTAQKIADAATEVAQAAGKVFDDTFGDDKLAKLRKRVKRLEEIVQSMGHPVEADD